MIAGGNHTIIVGGRAREVGGSVLRSLGMVDYTNDTPSVASRQLPHRGSQGGAAIIGGQIYLYDIVGR